MSNEIKLAHNYKQYNTTNMLEQDLKMIQRMNVVIGKFQKTQKLTYLFEAINIVHTLNNYLDIVEAKEVLLKLVDMDNKSITEYLIDNACDVNLTKLRRDGIVL